MAFLVGGANSAADTGYDIENSLRLNNDAELEFTPGSEGNRTTFTISVWVKRGNLGSGNFICSSGTGSGAKFELSFGNTDQLWVEDKNGVILQTAARYRDPSAWMHIVFKHDSTPATPDSSDVALYVNGSQITSFDTYETYPSQNAQCYWMDDVEHNIGKRTYSDVFFDGYMAEFVAIDGLALSPSSFGETDEDSGIWKPKDVSDLTFGTNGFYLEFKETGTNQDSSGIGADTSGEDNHFAVTSLAATDQTTDTPTNNFCTLNPLQSGYAPSYLVTLSEGNTQAVRADDNWVPHGSTMAVNAGKWYWENKWISGSGDVIFGVQAQEGAALGALYLTDNRYPGYYSGTVGVSYHTGSNYYHNGGSTDSNVEFVSGDIIMFAMDMDNGFLYAGKNGTWNDSGDPTSGGSGTGNAYSGFAAYTMMPTNASYNTTLGVNFGNPSFAISSGNADADGYGNFEYAVPSGYYALCTKNLAEYG